MKKLRFLRVFESKSVSVEYMGGFKDGILYLTSLIYRLCADGSSEPILRKLSRLLEIPGERVSEKVHINLLRKMLVESTQFKINGDIAIPFETNVFDEVIKEIRNECEKNKKHVFKPVQLVGDDFFEEDIATAHDGFFDAVCVNCGIVRKVEFKDGAMHIDGIYEKPSVEEKPVYVEEKPDAEKVKRAKK